jgi:hypothetical protein
MKKMYTTAMGKKIDLESLRAVNEETIAVGNMKVNARGDQLGPGGTVERSRNAAIADHYRLPGGESREEKLQRQRMSGASTTKTKSKRNSPPAESTYIMSEQEKDSQEQPQEQIAEDETPAPVDSNGRRLRGSLADSLAGEATVTQEKMSDPRRPKGPTRI